VPTVLYVWTISKYFAAITCIISFTLAYPAISFVCVSLFWFSLLRWSPLVGADGNTSGGRTDGGSGAA